MDLKKLAERYLELYPAKEKVYATPDGNFFLNRSDACNHAKASKSNYFEFERGKEGNESKPEHQQATVASNLKQRALQLDADTADYREMLTILKGLNLAAESNKKVDVIKAFKNYQASATEPEPETPTV